RHLDRPAVAHAKNLRQRDRAVVIAEALERRRDVRQRGEARHRGDQCDQAEAGAARKSRRGDAQDRARADLRRYDGEQQAQRAGRAAVDPVGVDVGAQPGEDSRSERDGDPGEYDGEIEGRGHGKSPRGGAPAFYASVGTAGKWKRRTIAVLVIVRVAISLRLLRLAKIGEQFRGRRVPAAGQRRPVRVQHVEARPLFQVAHGGIGSSPAIDELRALRLLESAAAAGKARDDRRNQIAAAAVDFVELLRQHGMRHDHHPGGLPYHRPGKPKGRGGPARESLPPHRGPFALDLSIPAVLLEYFRMKIHKRDRENQNERERNLASARLLRIPGYYDHIALQPYIPAVAQERTGQIQSGYDIR